MPTSTPRCAALVHPQLPLQGGGIAPADPRLQPGFKKKGRWPPPRRMTLLLQDGEKLHPVSHRQACGQLWILHPSSSAAVAAAYRCHARTKQHGTPAFAQRHLNGACVVCERDDAHRPRTPPYAHSTPDMGQMPPSTHAGAPHRDSLCTTMCWWQPGWQRC